LESALPLLPCERWTFLWWAPNEVVCLTRARYGCQTLGNRESEPLMEYEELCVAKSFSLKRNLIAGIRIRAAYLKMSMSAYIAALVHNDLVYGIERPLAINPRDLPVYPDKSKSTRAPRGVVVEFDMSDE